jgi:hypothetical protein
MPWKAIVLSQTDTDSPIIANSFRDEFAILLHKAKSQKGAVILLGRDDKDQTYWYFFSPQAVRISGALLQRHNARDCTEPPPGSTEFFAGDATSWELYLRP